MRKGRLSRFGMTAALGLGLTLTSGAGGCAKEVEPINQVQPDYIRKSDLVGTDPKNPSEWFMRQTVVDVGRTNTIAFPGLQDDMKRVRWDIQENFLVARKSYELVSGSDGKGAVPSRNDGVIVAMFPIQGHFDIRRAYNPASGEEQNVIVENRTDRAWHDREFMRVDWSRNLVTDPEGLFWFDQMFGDVTWEPVAYFETDPKSPNAPVYDTGKGYFDITNKMIAKTPNLWGITWLPQCWILNFYTGSEVMDCNDQEIAVRVSFMKSADRDYQPLETDSQKFAMFGTFNRDRWGFSRQYEILDQHWHRLAARHNLWEKSHDQRACMTSGDRAEADKLCASVAGSVCDPYAGEKGLCTVPYTQRKVRTIPYYVSRGMPADLWETNQKLMDEWNDALTGAVAAAREAECSSTGGGDCHAQFFDGDKPKPADKRPLVLCHNPVAKGDDVACGAEGTIAREGDLRYNLLAWVDQPLAAAPLGYGPNGADPLTGEVIQSTAYVYGASLDTYATMARDLVLVALGDIKPDDFIMGNHVKGSVGEYKPVTPGMEGVYGAYGEYLKGNLKGAVHGGLTDAQIATRLKGIQPESLVAKIDASAMGDKASAADRLAAVNAAIADKGVNGANGFGGAAEAEARMKAIATKLKGSPMEAEVIGTSDHLGANVIANYAAGDTAMMDKMREVTSPFGGPLSSQALSTLMERTRNHLEARGECIMGMNEFNAPHFEGLAKKLKEMYGDLSPEERKVAVFKELRRLIYKGVTEHEVGHTMALRHNFQGSWDSMNFHPNYWKLRTANGAATAACTSARTDAAKDTCMGPRYLDPETTEEVGFGAKAHAGIEEFAYSSIMDYGYDFNTDLHGLGAYDKAALKFIYGNAVEVLPKSSKVANQIAPLHAAPGAVLPRGPISEQWWVKRPMDAGLGSGEAVQPTHYTTLARIMQSEKLLFDAARCHDPAPGEENSAIDGKVCTAPAFEHASASDLVSGNLTGIDDKVYGSKWKVRDGRIRWPYRFGTDEYANYPHAMRFDAGADVYEASTNLAKLYEYRYVLDFFRRGRRGWFTFSVGQRVWDRYFSRMHNLGWLSGSKIAQYGAMYPTMKPEENPALKSDDWGRGYALAATELFETLERSILRPQPGGYDVKAEGVAGLTQELFEVPDWPPGGGKAFKVSILDGRWIDDELNNGKGGSFHYSEFHERQGTYVEKEVATAALLAQFPPVHTYYSRDTYVDGRNMLISFRSFMPKAFDRLFGSILTGDTDFTAPWVDRSEKKDILGNNAVHYPALWEDNPTVTGGNPVKIDPLVGYRVQVPALLYSFWFGQDDDSKGLMNSFRVWINGSLEGVKLPDSEKAFFYEPGSGVLWCARKYGNETVDGVTRPIGLGERMLYRANRLLAKAYKVEVGTDGLPVYDPVTHEPKWEAGAKPGELRGDADATKWFGRHIGLLNTVRNYIAWTNGI
jgi:hypothetical protein